MTQWVSVCSCDLLPSMDEDLVVALCPDCGKRTGGGRAGSFTQYIFRADLCACKRQELAGGGSPDRKRSEGTSEFVKAQEQELPLGEDVFPVERYKPLEELGRGAGGSVYLCRDRLLGKKVAVKILHQLSDEQLVAFQEEARATSRLDHPNVVLVLDFGATESGVPYMVLEYLRGRSLAEHLELYGPLSTDRAMFVLHSLAKAMEYAHSQGIFHRDLKPENVILIDEPEPGVKLIDFGVSRVNPEGLETTVVKGRTIVGTPAYMSPDQARGLEFDQRSEIYSLGCLAYEMFEGRQPFQGNTALEVILKHSRERPPALIRTPAMVTAVVLRCLAKRPGDRFQSMAELAAAIETLDPAEGQPAVSTGKRFRPSLPVAVMFVLSMAGVFLTVQYKPWRALKHSGAGTERKEPRTYEIEKVAARAYYVKGRVKAADLDAIARIKDLEYLRFDPDIDCQWQGLSRFEGGSLSGLLISKQKTFSDADMEVVLGLAQLKVIDLDHDAVTDRSLGRLDRLSNLVDVDLSYCKIGDETMAALGRLGHLGKLTLDGVSGITADGFAHLTGRRRLRRLIVDDCPQLGDGFLEHVASLPLSELSISADNITDEGVKYLVEHNPGTIRNLYLNDNPGVTDTGLGYLASLKSLEVLTLTGCRRISEEAVHDLFRKIPKVMITSSTVEKKKLKPVEDLVEFLGE
ncbi:MAG: protein kinase [Cyanobacteria bacterium HKST-UBA02]|nr:protein kinase [Cyanobacteria bacterium HKST-UBA02]